MKTIQIKLFLNSITTNKNNTLLYIYSKTIQIKQSNNKTVFPPQMKRRTPHYKAKIPGKTDKARTRYKEARKKKMGKTKNNLNTEIQNTQKQKNRNKNNDK